MEKLSHAYIIASPSEQLRRDTATELAAAMLCSGTGKKPCGLCRDCRKVRGGIHPDLTVISRPEDDSGRKKRDIVVGQIREMAADAAVLPNEAAGKVYVNEDADSMNEQAQNAALKLFEEPPAGVSFLLCAENPGKLLVTVRSRCVLINKNAGDEPVGDEADKMAREYIACVASGRPEELFAWCVRNEQTDGRKTLEFLTAVKSRLAGELAENRAERKHMMDIIELTDRCADYLRVNTGVKHVFGLLAVRSIGRNGE